jgi:chromosome segregation ATPase
MPRVYHVKKARKDNPVTKAGGSYYWWKFRYGPKMFSLTYPKRSQLTRSNFLSQLYDLQDELPDIVNGYAADDLESAVDELVNRIEEMRDECQESLDNMPEQLQDSSDAGMMLTERIDAMESWIDELQSLDLEVDEELTPMEKIDRWDEIRDEIIGVECWI